MDTAQNNPKRDDAALDQNFAQSKVVIRNHMLASAGVAVLPMPFVDAVAITGIQVKMLKDLAEIYGFKFVSTQRIYILVAALLAGLGLPLLTAPVLSGLLKAIPVIGQAAGVAALPVSAGASTYAVGRVFVLHFEAGGTLLSFDPAKVRTQMKECYAQGVQEMKKTPAEAPRYP